MARPPPQCTSRRTARSGASRQARSATSAKKCLDSRQCASRTRFRRSRHLPVCGSEPSPPWRRKRFRAESPSRPLAPFTGLRSPPQRRIYAYRNSRRHIEGNDGSTSVRQSATPESNNVAIKRRLPSFGAAYIDPALTSLLLPTCASFGRPCQHLSVRDLRCGRPKTADSTDS